MSTGTAPQAAGPRGHVRLIIALVIASLLGTFAVYTAFAGPTMPIVPVARASEHPGKTVKLTGKVLSTAGDASSDAGLRFTLEDDAVKGKTLSVVYHGSVPDAFRVGRHVLVDGRLDGATFVGDRDTLVAKCPSKYADGKPDS